MDCLCFIINILLSNCALYASKETKTIEELSVNYEDEKNFWIALNSNKDDITLYDDFYEEMDNRERVESSMNILFFGPPSSFMRLDTEAIVRILVSTKSHLIPLTRVILAWDLVTGLACCVLLNKLLEEISSCWKPHLGENYSRNGKTAAFLQGRELLAFGPLLNFIPEEDLYNINFGDPTVLRYFANENLGLSTRKMGILGAAYRRYFGNEWYANGTFINEMGNLLCAFPASDLESISQSSFKEINYDVFTKLKGCRHDQKQVLYKLAIRSDAYGEPYMWTSHEISRLDSLITYTPCMDISSIQLEAMSAISKRVLLEFSQKKLKFFTKQQVLRMNPRTRKVYIIRMQLSKSVDMDQLKKNAPNLHKTFNIQLFIGSVVALFMW